MYMSNRVVIPNPRLTTAPKAFFSWSLRGFFLTRQKEIPQEPRVCYTPITTLYGGSSARARVSCFSYSAAYEALYPLPDEAVAEAVCALHDVYNELNRFELRAHLLELLLD